MDATRGKKRKKRAAFVKFVKDIYRELFGEEAPLVLAIDFVRARARASGLFNSGSTADGRGVVAEHFADYLLSIQSEEVLIDDVTKSMAEGFADYLVNRANHNAGSANVRLEQMVTIFNAAKDAGLVESNPFKGVRVTDRVALHRQANRDEVHLPYTREHVHTMVERGIVAGRNPELTVAVLVSLDIGARGGDIFALMRACYIRERMELDFYVRKKKQDHEVIVFPPTHELLCEYLDHHLPDLSPKAGMFPTFQVPFGPDKPDRLFGRASSQACTYFHMYLVALGIRPAIKPLAENGRAVYTHGFHSGRGSSSTALIAAGHEQALVMARLLQDDEEINDGYNKFDSMGVCRSMYTKAGFKGQIPPEVEKLAHITHAEILQEIQFATERLRGLRGQLDLHDGTLPYGIKSWRARLEAPKVRKPKAKRRKAAAVDGALPAQAVAPIAPESVGDKLAA